MKSNLVLIEVLSLIVLELKRVGPALVEDHLSTTGDSWLLSGVDDSQALETLSRIVQTISSNTLTPDQFKDLFMSSNKPWTATHVQTRVVEHFFLSYLYGFSSSACAEAAWLALPSAEQPALKDVQKLSANIKQTWFERCPDAKKIESDQNFIRYVEQKLDKHNGSKTLISRTLLLSNADFETVILKCPFSFLSSFLASLNNEDEVEHALLQKIWSKLSNATQAEFTWSICNGQLVQPRAEAFKVWEEFLAEQGLMRKTNPRKKVA